MSTKVITGEVRFSYLHVFEPDAMDEAQTKKYSASLIIPKGDAKTIKAIEKAIDKAKEEGKTSKWNGKIPKNLSIPLRDGDEEREDDAAYADALFVNAKSVRRPGLVDKNLNAIMDQEEMYSGCYGRASISFYPYDANGNKGVACALNNLQKLRDGEPFAGGSNPEEDFGGDNALVADDDDL